MSYKITETVGDASITYEAPTVDEALKIAEVYKKGQGVVMSPESEITITTSSEVSAQDVVDCIQNSFNKPKTLVDIIPDMIDQINSRDFINVRDWQIEESGDWRDNTATLTFTLNCWGP